MTCVPAKSWWFASDLASWHVQFVVTVAKNSHGFDPLKKPRRLSPAGIQRFIRGPRLGTTQTGRPNVQMEPTLNCRDDHVAAAHVNR